MSLCQESRFVFINFSVFHFSLSGVAATIESLVQGYDRDFEGAAAESVAKE